MAAGVWTLVAFCLLAYAVAPAVRAEVEHVPIAGLLGFSLNAICRNLVLDPLSSRPVAVRFRGGRRVGQYHRGVNGDRADIHPYFLPRRGGKGVALVVERLWSGRHNVRCHDRRSAGANRCRADGAAARVPLNLLPLFVAPLILATHFFIFVRLRCGTV